MTAMFVSPSVSRHIQTSKSLSKHTCTSTLIRAIVSLVLPVFSYTVMNKLQWLIYIARSVAADPSPQMENEFYASLFDVKSVSPEL
jgi:hypothetical protein